MFQKNVFTNQLFKSAYNYFPLMSNPETCHGKGSMGSHPFWGNTGLCDYKLNHLLLLSFSVFIYKYLQIPNDCIYCIYFLNIQIPRKLSILLHLNKTCFNVLSKMHNFRSFLVYLWELQLTSLTYLYSFLTSPEARSFCLLIHRGQMCLKIL